MTSFDGAESANLKDGDSDQSVTITKNKKIVGEAPVFKARAIPDTHKEASIKPRLSKAAALRMGLPLPERPKRRESSTTSTDASLLGISGLPRSGVAVPKSLQAPTIAPRLNRIAAARTNQEASGSIAVMRKDRKPIDFSNTPGHKRQSLSSLSKPASLAAPTLAPRLNKIAAARLGESVSEIASSVGSGKISALDASRKPIDFSSTPGHKRMSVGPSTIKSLQAPTLAPRSNRVSLSRLGTAPETFTKPSQGINCRKVPLRSSDTAAGKENQVRREVDYSNTPGHKRLSTGAAIASLAQPAIAPRINTAARKRLSMSIGPGSGPSAEAKVASKVKQQASRPSSRSSISGAHQDDLHSRVSLRSNQGPPTSFRM